MITIKAIKKIMKEFDKTADEALDFLIKIEEANIRLQKNAQTIETETKPVFPVIDIETKEETPKKDEDDVYIDQHCNDDSYDKALAEGEARVCPLKDVEYTKQLLKDLPRTNPRVKKYLETAEGWIEKYQEIDHEYNINTFSVTSQDTEDTERAEESRLNAVYAFVNPLVTKAAELSRFDEKEEEESDFNMSEVQAFYDTLEEDQ